jgi:hypothetical protein
MLLNRHENDALPSLFYDNAMFYITVKHGVQFAGITIDLAVQFSQLASGRLHGRLHGRLANWATRLQRIRNVQITIEAEPMSVARQHTGALWLTPDGRATGDIILNLWELQNLLSHMDYKNFTSPEVKIFRVRRTGSTSTLEFIS